MKFLTNIINKIQERKQEEVDVLLELKRDDYSANTTLGTLDVNESRFCQTLEDTVRAEGVKVLYETAIPAGVLCTVGIHKSEKFGRDVLILFTEDDEITLKGGGVSFKYIYLHGGNKRRDTAGCPLTAEKRVNAETIYGSKEKDLFDLIAPQIREGKVVKFIAHNLPQEG